MEAIDELSEAAIKIIDAAQRIKNDAQNDIYKKAPKLVYQRLCDEFADIMRQNPTSLPDDIPFAKDLLIASRVIVGLYPELKNINY